MYISDILSHARHTSHNRTAIFADLEREMELQFCSLVGNSKVTDAKLLNVAAVHGKGSRITEFVGLRIYWKVPPELIQYWIYTEDIIYVYGLVLKGKAIVILKGLRPEILRSIHAAHQGQEKCIQRARGSFFGPEWHLISRLLLKVARCARNLKNLILGDVSFHTQSQIDLGRKAEFHPQTSSPHYPQSNGITERHVQTAKKMLKKVIPDQNDVNIALLELCNTRVKQWHSPAELVMGHRLMGCIPVVPALFNPSLPDYKEVHAALLAKQTEQKAYLCGLF
ncbi:hypothetical protein PR048_001091 [Dryococelus australis]|uniref:Integrase catalytic domain-containing protein n=1 Tax=Dryococelus australis TaxID=614101 RepID=A0ABQ9IGE1_9NEOP|nr:hypothetical protein PR048_001091 [Dryococelus australis]